MFLSVFKNINTHTHKTQNLENLRYCKFMGDLQPCTVNHGLMTKCGSWA